MAAHMRTRCPIIRNSSVVGNGLNSCNPVVSQRFKRVLHENFHLPLDSAMVAEWHSGVRSGEPFQLEDTDKDQDTFETWKSEMEVLQGPFQIWYTASFLTVQRHKVCMKEPVARTVIVTCASLRIKEMPLAHLSESIIDVLISQWCLFVSRRTIRNFGGATLDRRIVGVHVIRYSTSWWRKSCTLQVLRSASVSKYEYNDIFSQHRYFSPQVHKVSPIIVAVLERYSEDWSHESTDVLFV